MPIGRLKNTIYGMALPFAGQRSEWKKAHGDESAAAVGRRLRHRHVVGACVQFFEKGKLADCVTAGYAAMGDDKRSVTPNTIFRTASVAKMVSAMLVFRLQTLGQLRVTEDVSDLLGFRVRNPHCPDAPITLGMLLSHTSTIVDSPAYFDSFQNPAALGELLGDPAAFLPTVPGMTFRYSNLAAGMVACLLEARFKRSFEALMQTELFEPLGIQATFDLAALRDKDVANCYRVLPKSLAFDAKARAVAAVPMDKPDPQHHYLLASGGLFLSAPMLALLAIAAATGHDGFLDERSMQEMRHAMAGWPDQTVRMRHGMGLLCLEDQRVCPQTLWGHQGFAYGAVNGVFFDEASNGFAMLNNGASEQRTGHLALVNRDLIRLFWTKGGVGCKA